MILRVKPTPTRLYTPMDNKPLHSISSVCHPWGILIVSGLGGWRWLCSLPPRRKFRTPWLFGACWTGIIDEGFRGSSAASLPGMPL